MAAIGIDFGYSAIRVALLKKNGSEESVEVIEDENGNRSIPTVIAFDGKMRHIGDEANYSSIGSENIVYGLKRIIGRQRSDRTLIEHLKQFNVSNLLDENCKIKAQNGSHTSYTAEELLATIFWKIKKNVEKTIGQQVTTAVITVPSYFTHVQRQAVMDAAFMAGIEVSRLINDCTAAAVNYVFENSFNNNENSNNKKVLFFDCGGGSLDVSLIDITNNDITVVSTSGSTSLGGVDFDNCLLEFCVKILETKTSNITNNRKVINKLRKQCENAKIQLQRKNDVKITIEKEFIQISSNEFEKMCEELFDSITSCVDKCLRESDFEDVDVNEVMLLGGTSRLKKIEQYFSSSFVSPKFVKNGDLVVKGAAIMAAKLGNDTFNSNLSKITVSDLTPYMIGLVKPISDKIIVKPQFSKKPPVIILVDRNSGLPCHQSTVTSVKSFLNDDLRAYCADIDIFIGDSHLVHSMTKLFTVRLFVGRDTQLVDFKLTVNENGVYCVEPMKVESQTPFSFYLMYNGLKGINVIDEKQKFDRYKEVEKSEELRVLEKNTLHSEIIELMDDYQKLYEHILDEDNTKISEDIDFFDSLIRDDKEHSIESIQRKRSSVKECRQYIHESLKRAELEKNKISNDLAIKIDTIHKSIAQNKFFVDDSEIENVIQCLSEVNAWLIHESSKTIVALTNKVADINEIESKVNNLVSKGNIELQLLISQVFQLKTDSPFETFRTTSNFAECNEQLQCKINAFQTHVNNNSFDSISAARKSKQLINEFVKEKVEMMTIELSFRLKTIQEMESLKQKYYELLREDNVWLLTSSDQQLANTSIDDIRCILNECESRSTSELESSFNSYEKTYELLYKPIEQEYNRRRMLQDLHDSTLQFWTYNPKLIDKLKEDQLKKINQEIQEISEWCDNNPNATKQVIESKKERIENLHRNVVKQVNDNEEKSTKSDFFVGIDLGSSHCCVSVFKNEEHKVIEVDKKFRIPSCVAFTENGIEIGEKALNDIAKNPENTVFNFKHLIGRHNDDVLPYEIEQLPFTVDNSSERLKIVLKKDGTETLSVEEITALLLIKMKKAVEDYLKFHVKHISITVPANFRNSQRQATHDAALIARFEDIDLVNDNVALLLRHLSAHSTMNADSDEHYMLISMGAAYFNVSVARVRNGCIKVENTWSRRFGGASFDKHLFDYLFKSPQKKALTKRETSISLRRCEEAKIQLSKKQNAKIKVNDLMPYSREPEIRITRKELESCCRKLFDLVCETIDFAIEFAQKNGISINTAVIAGGSTCFPRIQTYLSKFKVHRYNDEDISCGAALYSAHIKNDIRRFQTIRDNNYFPYKLQSKQTRYIEIPSGTALPFQNESVFTNEMKMANCQLKLYEGDSRNEKLILEYHLKSKGLHKVMFHIDESGLVDVKILNFESMVLTQLDFKNRLRAEDVYVMSQNLFTRNIDLFEEDKANRVLVKCITDSRQILIHIQPGLSEKEVTEINKALSDAFRFSKCVHTAKEYNEKCEQLKCLVNQLCNAKVKSKSQETSP